MDAYCSQQHASGCHAIFGTRIFRIFTNSLQPGCEVPELNLQLHHQRRVGKGRIPVTQGDALDGRWASEAAIGTV